MSKLAQRSTSALAASGKSREQIAAEAETTEETLARLSRGSHDNPTLKLLERIAQSLGTTVGYLHGDFDNVLTPEDHRELRRLRAWIDEKLPRIDPTEKSNATLIGRAADPHARRRGSELESAILSDVAGAAIPPPFADEGATLVVRSEDDSMIEAGILPGDSLFVRRTNRLPSAEGKVVLCQLGGVVHVRRLIARGTQFVLESANARYAPIVVERKGRNFTVIGIVVGRLGIIQA